LVFYYSIIVYFLWLHVLD